MCVIVVMAADTLSRFGSGFAVSAGASPGLLLCFGPLLMAIAQLMLTADHGYGNFDIILTHHYGASWRWRGGRWRGWSSLGGKGGG